MEGQAEEEPEGEEIVGPGGEALTPLTTGISPFPLSQFVDKNIPSTTLLCFLTNYCYTLEFFVNR